MPQATPKILFPLESDMSKEFSEEELDALLGKVYEDRKPSFDGHVNVALVGKVSAGKSSLLNALLKCTRKDPLAEVGARSGVTTKITAYKLDEHVLIVDCPGLDDVRKENSEETKDFLNNIDLGLFVVTGSADLSQKANFEQLKASSSKTFVVLNKIDEWDDLEESAYEAVKRQWCEVLGVKHVYGTCTKGFDPKMRESAPMDIRGVDELREDVFAFLKTEGKALLFARHLRSKQSYAIGIIATAIAAVAGEAFIPGSAAYITATQVIAITSLNYLYTGEVLNKSSALALLPTFIGETLGTSTFLLLKSFLPPTFILDATAAAIAVAITFAMLATVKWMLENEHSLDDKKLMKQVFGAFKNIAGELKSTSVSDLTNKANIIALIARLLAKPF